MKYSLVVAWAWLAAGPLFAGSMADAVGIMKPLTAFTAPVFRPNAKGLTALGHLADWAESPQGLALLGAENKWLGLRTALSSPYGQTALAPLTQVMDEQASLMMQANGLMGSLKDDAEGMAAVNELVVLVLEATERAEQPLKEIVMERITKSQDPEDSAGLKNRLQELSEIREVTAFMTTFYPSTRIFDCRTDATIKQEELEARWVKSYGKLPWGNDEAGDAPQQPQEGLPPGMSRKDIPLVRSALDGSQQPEQAPPVPIEGAKPARGKRLEWLLGPDPDASYEEFRRLGQDLVAGEIDQKLLGERIAEVQKLARTALRSTRMSDTSKKFVELFLNHSGSHLLPIDGIEQFLTAHIGLEVAAEGKVSLNMEMDDSFNVKEGHREIASIYLLQARGASPDGPGVVEVNYAQPSFVDLGLKGTAHDRSSGARSIYFVENASLVKGLEGDTHAGSAEVKARLETLYQSLESLSPVQLHSYRQGYGNVETSYLSRIKAGALAFGHEDPVTQDAAAALAVEHAVARILGVGKAIPSRRPPGIWDRLLNLALQGMVGALAGALVGALGYGLAVASGVPAGQLGGTAAVVTVIEGLTFGWSYMETRDYYVGNIPGSYEAFLERRKARFRAGFLMGAAMGLTLALGVLGPPGVALAAGSWALVWAWRGAKGRP